MSDDRARGLAFRFAVLTLAAVGCLLVAPAASAATPSPEPDLRASDSLAAQAAEPEATVSGRLSHDDEPLPGVEVVVTGIDDPGFELTAVSDNEGRWLVELPSNGQYTVTLIEETLPEGVGLRSGTTNERTIDTSLTQSASALFPTGDEAVSASSSGSSTTRDTLTTRLFYGVNFGLLLALAAVGVSLIFGTTGVNNFAHGEILTFGALSFYVLFVLLDTSLLTAAVTAIGVTALLGLCLERTVFAPLRRRHVGLIETILVTIALSLFLRYAYLLFFGGSTHSVSSHITRVVNIGPVTVTLASLVSMVVSLVVLSAVGLALGFTRTGRSMRAVRDNAALAQLTGISVNGVGSLVWFVGGAVTGLSGVLYSLYRGVSWDMGFAILLLLFAAVTLGGIGNIFGSLLGALIIGITTEASTVFIPADLRYSIALAALILVLIFRPEGLFTRKVRVG